MTAHAILYLMWQEADGLPSNRGWGAKEIVRFGAETVLNTVQHHPATDAKGHRLKDCPDHGCIVDNEYVELWQMANGHMPGGSATPTGVLVAPEHVAPEHDPPAVESPPVPARMLPKRDARTMANLLASAFPKMLTKEETFDRRIEAFRTDNMVTAIFDVVGHDPG